MNNYIFKKATAILLIGATTLSINKSHAQNITYFGVNPVSLTIAQTVRGSFISQGLAPTSATIIAAQARMSAGLASAIKVARSPIVLAIGTGLIVGTVLRGSSNPEIPNSQPIIIESNNDGTVTTTKWVPQIIGDNPVNAPATAPGSQVFSAGWNKYASLASLMSGFPNAFNNPNWHSSSYGSPQVELSISHCSIQSDGFYIRCQVTNTKTGRIWNEGGNSVDNTGYVATITTADYSCPANNYQKNGVCTPLEPPPPPTGGGSGGSQSSSKTQTIEQAVEELTPEEKAQPLSPDTIANLINALGNQINQDPTYNGPPLPTNISPTQVGEAMGIIGVRPTVGDMTSPTTPERVAYDPISSPTQQGGNTVPINGNPANTAPAPAPSVPDADSKPDFGIDPGIQTPGIEGIPTAQNILSPILNMLPGFRTWQLPAHSGVCPTGEFEIYGKQFSINSHCYLLEKLRPYITPMATAGWTVLAIIIFLGA